MLANAWEWAKTHESLMSTFQPPPVKTDRVKLTVYVTPEMAERLKAAGGAIGFTNGTWSDFYAQCLEKGLKLAEEEAASPKKRKG